MKANQSLKLMLASTLTLGVSSVISAETSSLVRDLGTTGEVRANLLSDATSFEKSVDLKCGEGKCGEGKCGEKKSKDAKSKDTKSKDAKSGEEKAKEAKCGEKKSKEAKSEEKKSTKEAK